MAAVMSISKQMHSPSTLLFSHHHSFPSLHMAQLHFRNTITNVSKGSNLGSLKQLFAQVLTVPSQRLCTIVLCLFMLNLEITGGEPQVLQASNERGNSMTSKMQVIPHETDSSKVYMQQHSMMGNHEGGNSNGEDHDDDTAFYQHRLLTTMGPHLMESPTLHSNHSSLIPENTASVIASSFRNFEASQPTTDSDEGSTRMGTTHNVQGGPKRKSKRCDIIILTKCLEGLPPMNDTGIPSTPQAVNKACRFYNTGINCFDSWAKTCLVESQRQKVKASITGAHEMYSFLCRDPKFRSDYLKHKDCYKKLTPYWDNCSRQFIDGVRRNTKHNNTAFCCIRLEFYTCVSKSSSYFCSLEATKFLMKMAETLIRSSIRTAQSQTSDYCTHVHPHHCVPIVESSALGNRQFSATQFFVTWILSVIFSLVMSSRV